MTEIPASHSNDGTTTTAAGITDAEPAPREWKPAAAVVAVLLMWASAFVAIRGIGTSFSPGPLALGRMLVGGLVLAVFAVRARRPLPQGRALGMVAAYGLLWFAGYNVLLNAAERHLDAGTAAMLVNVAPILVAVGAGVFLREGFPRQLLVGIGIAFIGVVLIAFGGSGGHSDGFGILLGLVTAVLYAAGVLTQKVALKTVDALTATWVGCGIGALALLGWLPSLIREWSAAGTTPVLSLIYLGVFPTAIAFSLWAYALQRSDAGVLTSSTLAVPAIVVLASLLVLGEVPTIWAIIGGAVALTGVAIGRVRRRRTNSVTAAG
ncbi:DMT family transporter [Nakamurella sp. A5-74]|uniref:DMT family transporter n=1 Tax=Nakamurella sp. A5-74 TaxID=3158264 RepID=A0AAU8DIV5_9ACTN